MQLKKLTPLEILHKQKTGLQTKSDELGKSIENHTRYLQQNCIPLLRDNMIETVVSKLSPQLQNFAAGFLSKEQKANSQEFTDSMQNSQDSSISKFVLGIAAGVVEIIPFFLKGKKGALLAILSKQIFNWVLKQY